MHHAKNHIDHLLNNCIDDSAESCSIMSKAKQAIGMLVTSIEPHTKKNVFVKQEGALENQKLDIDSKLIKWR